MLEKTTETPNEWFQNKAVILIVVAFFGGGSLGGVGGLSFGNGSSEDIHQVSETQTEHNIQLKMIQTQLHRLEANQDDFRRDYNEMSKSLTFCETTIGSISKQLDRLLDQGGFLSP